jgi:hypothetical protein
MHRLTYDSIKWKYFAALRMAAVDIVKHGNALASRRFRLCAATLFSMPFAMCAHQLVSTRDEHYGWKLPVGVLGRSAIFRIQNATDVFVGDVSIRNNVAHPCSSRGDGGELFFIYGSLDAIDVHDELASVCRLVDHLYLFGEAVAVTAALSEYRRFFEIRFPDIVSPRFGKKQPQYQS